MGTDKDIRTSTDAARLRGNAEERQREMAANPGLPRTPEEMLRLVHELQVHQIELEMQNEQLRQTRHDLETSLEQCTDLYDFAPVGYFTIDGDSIIHSVNLSGASLLGIERSYLIGRQLRHLIADEDRLVFTEFLKGEFENQGKESCYISLRREGNTSIFVHMEGAFAPDRQEYRITLSDITDRIRTEDRLLESENRFKYMFRNHAAVMLLIEPESGSIIDANKAAEDFYGYTTKYLLDMKISNINILSHELITYELQTAIKEQRNYFIFKHRIASGEIRDVEVHSTPITIRNSTVLFSIIHDITERKQAEEALKSSEERYHQLFEMESDTVFMVDWESGRILEANSAATRMYGYTREEFLRLAPSDLSNEPSETESYMHIEETGVALRWHRKKDGTVFPVEITGSYYVYRGRKVHAAAIRDISERLRAEQHMLDLNQRLRALGGRLQSVQEQERLTIARDMHDDVGQILTTLKLDLGWLEQNIAPSDNDVPPRLKEMHRNVDQITTVVQRIAANLRPPLLDNQGLSAAIEWHAGEFGKRSGIECFVMINEDTDAIDKETATAIMRILQEGLTNIARHARASEVGISLCTRDGNLLLEITDNGCGITPEQMASPEAYGLMGMQERAKLCNGTLEIKGEPGVGTILLLTIPLDSRERAG